MKDILLIDICRPKQWKTISMQEMKSSGYPVFGANGVIGYYDKYTHEKPTLLITCRGATCGTLNISLPFSYVNGNAMALDNLDSESVDLKFLFHYLKHRSLKDTITGTAQPQITRDSLKKVRILLPLLPEQKRIAEVLDKADDLREKRRLALQKLDTLLQSVFTEMFGDPVKNPKGWDVLTVGECLKKGFIKDIQDGNHGEIHPKVSDFAAQGVPFIMANCIVKDRLDLRKSYRLSPDFIKKLRIGFATSGDVLLTHKGSIGLVTVIPSEIETIILSPQVTYYRLDNSKISSNYLAEYFKTEFFQRLLSMRAKQSTRDYIGITRQKSLPIMIPDLEIQKRFSDFVVSHSALRFKFENSFVEAENLFQSLRQRAFKGELFSNNFPPVKPQEEMYGNKLLFPKR